MSEAKYSKRYESKSNAGRKFNLLQYLVGKKGKSKFGSSTTSEEVVKSWDGSGKCAIVTGAFTGLGLHVSRVLASRGCEVVMAGRGRVRGGKVCHLRYDTMKWACPDPETTETVFPRKQRRRRRRNASLTRIAFGCRLQDRKRLYIEGHTRCTSKDFASRLVFLRLDSSVCRGLFKSKPSSR